MDMQSRLLTDWPVQFAGLTMAALPMIVLFLIGQRQFLRGLTDGIGSSARIPSSYETERAAWLWTWSSSTVTASWPTPSRSGRGSAHGPAPAWGGARAVPTR